jgi:hypothetical protein
MKAVVIGLILSIMVVPALAQRYWSPGPNGYYEGRGGYGQSYYGCDEACRMGWRAGRMRQYEERRYQRQRHYYPRD